MSLEVIYQDAALAVVAKPAGLSSEQGLPQALRQLWGEDAYVGIVHRLDTPTTGLMVCARTPAAAAALTRQITDSAAWYAASPDARPADGPSFIKRYRAVVAAGDNAPLEDAGLWQDLLFKDSRTGRVYPGAAPPQGGPGCRAGVPGSRPQHRPCPGGGHPAHRPHPPDPGAVCRPPPPPVGGRTLRQPLQRRPGPAMYGTAFHPPRHRPADASSTLPPPSGEPWSLLAAGER